MACGHSIFTDCTALEQVLSNRMNYYVYHNGQHIRSFHTEQEGAAWVVEQIKGWRNMGARGHGEYKVVYNSRFGKPLTWPAEDFTTKDKRAAELAIAIVEQNAAFEESKRIMSNALNQD